MAGSEHAGHKPDPAGWAQQASGDNGRQPMAQPRPSRAAGWLCPPNRAGEKAGWDWVADMKSLHL